MGVDLVRANFCVGNPPVYPMKVQGPGRLAVRMIADMLCFRNFQMWICLKRKHLGISYPQINWLTEHHVHPAKSAANSWYIPVSETPKSHYPHDPPVN